MSYHQPRLFGYTRTSELLIGLEVIEMERVRQRIKTLQNQQKMEKDWKLDIYCRNPAIIGRLTIEKIDTRSAAYSYGQYAISLEIQPQSIRSYTLSIGWFYTKGEAEVVLEDVQAYITYRYGV